LQERDFHDHFVGFPAHHFDISLGELVSHNSLFFVSVSMLIQAFYFAPHYAFASKDTLVCRMRNDTCGNFRIEVLLYLFSGVKNI